MEMDLLLMNQDNPNLETLHYSKQLPTHYHQFRLLLHVLSPIRNKAMLYSDLEQQNCLNTIFYKGSLNYNSVSWNNY